LPIWRPAAVVGAQLADAARNTLAAAIVIVLGVAMGFRADGGVVGVLLAVVLPLIFSFSLAWMWSALALVLRTPSSVSNVSLLFVFPLTFASNVFVKPQTMPGLAADNRRRQPNHAPGDRGARPDARHRDGPAGSAGSSPHPRCSSPSLGR
jgi:hypothetical protein